MALEILAPVGGAEQLTAAIRCGADAVYLGTKGFNARRNAENFAGDDLASTVSICHANGVRVHVTVNTLVMDSEMDDLYATMDEVASSGADAVIVQDLGVMELFRRRYPSLPIHASTQCVVHNTDGALFYRDMGVSRVVVARELSLREIEKIRRETGMELEAFVHGALCMSLSGACSLSALIGGRSGNRGLCAQPCRLDFRCGGSNYALSLKDMSHIRHIRDMADAGVTSFKIEGRMKRPEYVAAAVTACRKALNGEEYDIDTLRAVFSRSGFTDGYITGKRQDMFGHRGKDDVTAAESVFGTLRRLYAKPQPRVPVDMSLDILPGDKSVLSVSALGKSVTVSGGEAIAAETRPTDVSFAEKSLSKCGGTQFYLGSIEVKNDAGLMLPPSSMNALRRDALAKLNDALSETVPYRRENYTPAPAAYTPPEASALWARFETAEQVCQEDDLERIILPARLIEKSPDLIGKYGDKLTAELPPVLFPEDEDKTRKTAENLRTLGVTSVWAENCYAVELGRRLGFTVYGGAGLNVMNTGTLEAYRAAGLSAATVSFELNMGKISRLSSSLPRGYICYGRLPVMQVRNCPAKAARGCAGCDGRPTLRDRIGAEFPMLCREKKYTTILNSVPLHIGGKQQAKADFKLMYFTLETRDECSRAIAEILADEPSDAARTGGLYYRTVK